MKRPFNFGSGPAMLPLEVLEQARDELIDWRGSGMSVMEMSHRGKEYMGIHARACSGIRELLGIPSDYRVLFMPGGATSQFAMVPMNLFRGKTSADYLDTGVWSARAIDEARKFGRVKVVASSRDGGYSRAPAPDEWKTDRNAAYFHYTPNETIGGVEIFPIPDTGGVPLVADMSSNLLSRPLDVSRFGLIYAGAQKNIGPAGVTIVIARDDLLGKSLRETPTLYDYRLCADGDSMVNTPPTYAIYIAGLVFEYLKAEGGLAVMEGRARQKAGILYDFLDSSDFYETRVARENRSLTNITFRLKDETRNDEFVKAAESRGLLQIRGHRLSGGMRASIYNAMPVEGVRALVDFMKDFEARPGQGVD
ncbi:MAG: 3-phosphoserine/phosphohydroxythreonine transaminase [Candidatus Accumulibacter sp.]|jgi:phosphoserine aminotransferase|nr:3-phosphoserine/phosphohydroxythreonine transaminase [Accumulibacter sp.]